MSPVAHSHVERPMRKSQNRGSIEWTVKARRDLEEILVSMSKIRS